MDDPLIDEFADVLSDEWRDDRSIYSCLVATFERTGYRLTNTRPAADPGEYGELIWRLRNAWSVVPAQISLFGIAATALETQAADIARLREGLVAARMAFGIPNVSDEVKQNAIERIDAALSPNPMA